jgi:hypothetical protein
MMPNVGPDPQVSDEQLIAAIAETETPVASAQDVSGLVDLSRQRCAKRLQRLAENGRIKEGTTSKTTVYWLGCE